jgi:outer membrane protein insertion porin family
VHDNGTKGGLPLYERIYMGGSRSLRGFATRSISLRDEHDIPVQDQFGNLLGGTSYVQGSLEYHLLLGGPFRLVFFADGGNVFGEEGLRFGTHNLRGTAGAELRLFVPVFGLPLRFIYAKNLTPLPGDRFESFQFDVGTSF